MIAAYSEFEAASIDILPGGAASDCIVTEYGRHQHIAFAIFSNGPP
jgi:hypothetical protein